jgi:hypothetical protein
MSAVFLILIPFQYILIFLACLIGLALIMYTLFLAIKYWHLSFIIISIFIFLEHSKNKEKLKYRLSSQRDVYYSIQGQGTIKNLTQGAHNPLYIIESNNNKCTGFAINDHYLITAYHCVKNNDYVKLTNPDFKKNHSGFNQEGIVVSIDKNIDIALIKGSFKDVRKYYFPEEIKEYGTRTITCGAPNHRSQIDCFRVKNLETTSNYIKGEGFSRPGMSGSPLLEERENTVRGVLTGATGNQTFYVPINKALEAMDIYPEDVQWKSSNN